MSGDMTHVIISSKKSGMHWSFFQVLFILGVFLMKSILATYPTPMEIDTAPDVEVDFYLLSISWLPTGCLNYRQKRGGKCLLPKDANVWTIHGLWPQGGNEMGPFYCNKSMKFDVSILNPIRQDMEVFWRNIMENKTAASFWQHEWDKHGTCALTNRLMDTQLKYFNETLNLYKQNDMNKQLPRGKIYPSSNQLYISEFHDTVKRVFGKQIRTHCIRESRSGQFYIDEIRICFTTNLDVIDCDSHKLPRNMGKYPLSDCPYQQPVFYPTISDIPEVTALTSGSCDEKLTVYVQLNYVLKLIKFLLWSFL